MAASVNNRLLYIINFQSLEVNGIMRTPTHTPTYTPTHPPANLLNNYTPTH
jgi:hypothetical protein